MITLEYYDDEKVKKNSYFLTTKLMLLISVIGLFLSIIFVFALNKNSDNFELLNNIDKFKIIFFTFFSVFFLFCLILILWDFFEESYRPSFRELYAKKIEYEQKRKKILSEHKYNYSIFECFCGEIVEEILCDSFNVDSYGYAYILDSESDFVLTEQEYKKMYHHIVDNRDGHTITVKELKEKYLYKIEEKKDD